MSKKPPTQDDKALAVQYGIDVGNPDKYYYCDKSANRVINFFEKILKLSKGSDAGKPFKLLDWQKKLLRNLFGVKRTIDGYRRYKKCYVEIPRKNGKTETAAGLALYMLMADGEKGAEVYSAAGDHTQAQICLEVAQSMVRQSEILSEKLTSHRNQMFYVSNGIKNKYQAVTSKAETKHGSNPSAVIYDEVHVAEGRDLYEAFNTGFGARKQPLFFMITTSGRDRASLCYELHKYSKDVSEGRIPDETWFSLIYGVDYNSDWTDAKEWAKANPSIGQTISLEALESDFNKAKNSPGESLNFRQYRLCQWVDAAQGWLDTLKWEQLATTNPINTRADVYIGLDLAYRDDMTALSCVFPLPNGEFFTTQQFFCPKNNLSGRGKSKQMDYTTWAEEGYLTLTEGETTDFDFVIKKIEDLAKQYRVKEIAIDPSHAAHLINILDKKGFTIVELAPSNVKRMSSTFTELNNLINNGKLKHDHNPVMSWMVGNCVASYDAYENIRVQKSRATEKIDGVIATALALDRALMNNVQKKQLPTGFFTIKSF